MALSRITNYVDGNILTGAQLNNEFDNIINNGASLVSLAIPSYSAVSGLTGTISANIGSFAANAYQLKSTSTICSLTATSSYSVNTQTAGPIVNGRDQAAVFGSTDVHFYAITTGGTSTSAAGVCSSRPPETGPVLPTGYTAWAYLVSAKYSTGSSAMLIPGGFAGYLRGSNVIFQTPLANLLTTSNAVGVETPVTVSSWVPATATEFTVNVRNLRTMTAAAGTQAAGQHDFGVDVGVPLIRWNTFQQVTTALAVSPTVNGAFSVPVLSSQTARVLYTHTVTVGTSASCSIDLLSYKIPNGDVG